MERYSTTEFAKKAHVSVRTIRYYRSIGLLKPAYCKEDDKYYYTEEDFFVLQKILSLKYFGFSLKEVEALACDNDPEKVSELFDLQIKLIHKKIDTLKQVESGLINAKDIIQANKQLKWEDVINLIYLLNMEEQLLEQYKNSENISVRIRLHAKCSVNKKGWFPWVMDQTALEDAGKILELGCGNGEFWKSVEPHRIKGKEVVLSDISAGMIQDAMSNLKAYPIRYMIFDCREIPFGANTFDRVVANFLLFYVKNIPEVLREVCRVLEPGGMFLCSTYGKKHMWEINELVRKFDSRISLSDIELYKIFGIENGQEILETYFEEVIFHEYEDCLYVDDVDLLCDYIYSCHGNQNEILNGRKEAFKKFLKREMQDGKIRITKEAGAFICRKPRRVL